MSSERRVDYVKITRRGDSNTSTGQILLLETFLNVVKLILVNGGEMPVAVLESNVSREVP